MVTQAHTHTSTITTRPRYQAPPPTAVCSIRSYTVVQIKIPNQKPGYTVCLCLQGVPYHWAHFHSVNFPRGVVHRVENGWGLTKVAAVLLNGLIW